MKKFTMNEDNQQFISISIKDGTDPAKVLAYISGKYPTINGNVYAMDGDEILLNLEGDVHYNFALNSLRSTVAEVAEADVYTFYVETLYRVVTVEAEDGNGCAPEGERPLPKASAEEAARYRLLRLAKTQKDGDRCPRCGAVMPGELSRHALSRSLDIMVCDECGTEEAILAFKGTPVPLTEWAAVEEDWPWER